MRKQMVAAIVGLALALFVILSFLKAVEDGDASFGRDWKAGILIAVVAFGIVWGGSHIIAIIVADRRRAVLFGLLLVAMMALYPPWIYTFNRPGAPTTTRPAGYHLLFDPPSPNTGPRQLV